MNNRIKEFYRESQFLRVLALFIVILIPWLIAGIWINNSKTSGDAGKNIANMICTKEPPAFHTKFDELMGPFESAKDVTQACLGCHTERHKEILKTAHWNWEKEDLRYGTTSIYYGKRTAINNFCIGVQGSETTCTRCHIGYGYADKNFNFNDANAIDCLVCHDNTGLYKKARGAAGFPASGDKAPDYRFIAQRVCSPKKENCGVCHFWGGGGNNVKHGDLEKSLLNCDRSVDVHMAKEGPDMACIACHKTQNHNITGRSYATTFTNSNRVNCEQCHGEKPHADRMINRHLVKVSCQACHIPEYAKVNATKMYWDWSTAGRLGENGEPLTLHDHEGNHTYLSIKGDFIWDKHVVPEYIWFNGTADHYLLGEQIDTVPLQMNRLKGKYSCADSKIIPVKVHRGKQIFDPVNNYLIQPKLHADRKGEGAYWMDFDWNRANELGMANVNLPYSGKYDWVETEMYMPINHMVSPRELTVSCKECHSRDGRLTTLKDFYMPGRDRSKVLDLSGIALILVSLGGVFIHGLIRIFTHRN